MRMVNGALEWLSCLAIFGLVLTGCGSESSTSVSKVDTGIASECWTAEMIGSGEGGGSDVAHQQWNQPPAMTIDVNKTYTASIVTSAGAIGVEFFAKDAPKTVNNWVCLARAGYFDNTPFHRIIDGFVIQGGDPTGTGTGSPGYRFEDEPISKEYEKGTLAMANSGPNTNGSQFFICTDNLKGKLPKNYTIFGKVVSGMDVVDKLNKTPVQASRSGERSSPINPVTLISATITEN
jgi:cyclophilin family peptidyl-prolyl cis-trans isomerase